MSKIKELFTKKEISLTEKTTIVLFIGKDKDIEIYIHEINNWDDGLTYLGLEHELKTFEFKHFPKKNITVVWCID